MDWKWDHSRFDPPQGHHQFSGPCHIEMQVVQLNPCDKVIDDSAKASLIPSTDASNYGPNIRELVKVTGLWLIAKVCGVEGEEEGREDSSLRCHSVAEHRAASAGAHTAVWQSDSQ